MCDFSFYNSQLKDTDLVQFTNCFIIDNGVEQKADLLIRDQCIVDGQSIFYEEQHRPNITIDCKGCMICPGFIDLQINGGYGVDFSDTQVDIKSSVQKVAKNLVKTGVTAFCPTIITSAPETYAKFLPEIKRSESSVENGAAVLGIHLEGPFINAARKGAHKQELIKEMDNGTETVLDMYGKGLENASIVTLAPELNNSLEVIKYLTDKRNICVSLGHSASNLLNAEKAINAGAKMITHLFNAMLPYHHREPQMIGLLTSDKIKHQIYFGIIADEIHTHPSALRLAWKALPSGLVLVTDAMAALGLGEGIYNLGSYAVKVMNDKAVLSNDENTLAGSIATIPQCIWNLSKSAKCSLAQAVRSATYIPAQVIKSNLGTLKYGSCADFVIMKICNNTNLSVMATFTKGKVAYIDDQYELDVKQK